MMWFSTIVVPGADHVARSASSLSAHERIFEPFFATKGGADTGLGLVISYRIVVDRHHGQTTFQSRLGESRFEVRLPLDSGGLKKARESTGCVPPSYAYLGQLSLLRDGYS